jgi:hypothetical protein
LSSQTIASRVASEVAFKALPFTCEPNAERKTVLQLLFVRAASETEDNSGQRDVLFWRARPERFDELLNLKRQRVSPPSINGSTRTIRNSYATEVNPLLPDYFLLVDNKTAYMKTKMIRSTLALALAVGFSLAALSSANKDFITLHTTGNAWIQEAIATLVLPEIPYPVTGDIALWSAIMMDDYNGDFLQGVTSSSPL